MIQLDVKLKVQPTSTSERWRVLHDWEIPGYGCRENVPEVYTLGEAANHNNSHVVPLSLGWQLFSFNLFSWAYFGLPAEALPEAMFNDLARRWTAVHDDKLAFCNLTGSRERANYILGENLDSAQPIAYDKVRVCGGNTITGVVDGTNLRVNTFDWNSPPPLNIDPLTDLRISWATQIIGEGKVIRFGQLGAVGVPMPMISKQSVYLPLSWLAKLYPGVPVPSPYVP